VPRNIFVARYAAAIPADFRVNSFMSSGQIPNPGTNAPPLLINDLPLQVMYDGEIDKIRRRFEESLNGEAAVRERSDLLDAIIAQLWGSEIDLLGEKGLCAVAPSAVSFFRC
jgi:hypothetical protein